MRESGVTRRRQVPSEGSLGPTRCGGPRAASASASGRGAGRPWGGRGGSSLGVHLSPPRPAGRSPAAGALVVAR